MLNSKKILKRYCKATFNVFYITKINDETKNKIYDRFFVSKTVK